MDLGLHDKRALLLASSSGLGAATAAALTAEGARVAVHSRDAGRAEAARRRVGAALAVSGDLTQAGVAAALVEQALDAFDGLDILVVNTGGGGAGDLLHKTAADDERAYQALLRPALDAARRAAPALRASGDGRMLFLTARSAAEASTDLALSSVFRSGVAAAAKSLALSLAPEVLVNVIITGQFDTESLARFEIFRAGAERRTPAEVRAEHEQAIPLGRVGRAEELAAVACFLCSARASFVTGAALRVDGGALRGF